MYLLCGSRITRRIYLICIFILRDYISHNALLQDCPPEAADFRAQQCSAHADVRHQGQYHEWLPVDNDPDNPCALKCLAQGSGLLVELAPKVLDGTRCYTESLDMCISGACQVGVKGEGGGGKMAGVFILDIWWLG